MIPARFQTPQVLIVVFLILLMGMAYHLDIPLPAILSDSLVRLGMNGVLVLSLAPMLNAGIGINFGLPVGIIAGLIGLCVAVNFRITHLAGFLTALLCSVPISVFFGALYSRLLNRVAGKEEIAATFVGFSLVSASDLFWATAPFGNPAMLWPIGGQGMRPIIGLKGYFEKVLNSSWAFSVAGITVPVGLLLCFGLLCGLLHLFSKTKTGKAILAVGENETFARLAGIDVRGTRAIAVVLSTLIGAWGIIVYAQSYGFIELYDAPLMMAFPAASAILIGGAIGRRARILHVILGTYLLQTTYILSAPIANAILIPEVAEILRMMITNLVILYAMLHRGGASSP
jgi:simple sugar transport system permease protein